MIDKIQKIYKHKVFQNFSILMFGNVTMQVLNVIAIIYVTKIFKPDSFGLFSYMISQSFLLATIADLGIRNIAIRTIARDHKALNKIYSTSIISVIFTNSILILLYFIYNISFGSFTLTQISLIYLSSIVIGINNVSENGFVGYQKMTPIAITGIGYSLIWLTLVLLFRGKEISIEELFFIYICVTAFKPIFLTLRLIRKFELKFDIVNFFTFYNNLLKQSLPYWGLVLVSLPANFLANNFLEINSTIDQVGFFSLATKFALPISMILTVLLSALFPNLSVIWSENPNKFNNLIKKGVPIFIIIGTILAFLLTIFLTPVFSLFFSIEYNNAVTICKIQVWYTVLMGICSLIGTIWGAMNKEKLAFKMAIVNSIINTPMLWFGSKYGGYGLSIAYVVSFAIFMIILWTIFTRTNKIPPKYSLIWLFTGGLFILSTLI